MNVKTGEMEQGNRRGQIHDLQRTEKGRVGDTENMVHRVNTPNLEKAQDQDKC